MAVDIYRQSSSVRDENTLHDREVEETKKYVSRMQEKYIVSLWKDARPLLNSSFIYTLFWNSIKNNKIIPSYFYHKWFSKKRTKLSRNYTIIQCLLRNVKYIL